MIDGTLSKSLRKALPARRGVRFPAAGAAVLAAGGAAMAVTDTEFLYTTTQIGYLSIHPAHLVPVSNAAADSYSADVGIPARLFFDGGVTGHCYWTGLKLPQKGYVGSVENVLQERRRQQP